MTGDKGSQRLVKFGWVLSATVGAVGGAVAATFLGLSDTIWSIVGVGLPIGAAVGLIEWRAEGRAVAARKASPPEARHRPALTRRSSGHKLTPRRGQLHAITRPKTAEPPSSGGS